MLHAWPMDLGRVVTLSVGGDGEKSCCGAGVSLRKVWYNLNQMAYKRLVRREHLVTPQQ